MLKRALWLSLCCAAMLLLMGLMVRHQAQTQPPPPRARVFAALAPLPAPEPRNTEDAREPAVPDRTEGTVRAFAPAGLRLPPLRLTLAYHLGHYHAFHYSDEAG